MVTVIRQSLVLTVLLALLLCGAYPLAVRLAGATLFPVAASGGFLEKNGAVVGAELIGQPFTQPEYIHGRPSAAGKDGYDATASGGSNLGPTNKALAERIAGDVDRALAENPGLEKGKIPVDLVTASASGLDPHLSPEAAKTQAARVAASRGLPAERVLRLVDELTEGPQLGLFGEARVNVLRLNLALDGLR